MCHFKKHLSAGALRLSASCFCGCPADFYWDAAGLSGDTLVAVLQIVNVDKLTRSLVRFDLGNTNQNRRESQHALVSSAHPLAVNQPHSGTITFPACNWVQLASCQHGRTAWCCWWLMPRTCTTLQRGVG
jgi:hypothetical protein